MVPSGPLATTPFLTPAVIVRHVGSTMPPNGDLNPYGVAVAPETTGTFVHGIVLVSNFNARSNVQGTGVTIVQSFMLLSGHGSAMSGAARALEVETARAHDPTLVSLGRKLAADGQARHTSAAGQDLAELLRECGRIGEPAVASGSG